MEKTTMIICEPNACTGCMACMNICPYNAIEEHQDKKGFYIPFIFPSKCVECGLCQRVCPVNQKNFSNDSKYHRVYGCWNIHEEIRKKSSSGGIFPLLAKKVISLGGVVFGAIFNSETKEIIHTQTSSIEGLTQMYGSKYVQSKMSLNYRDVKQLLQYGYPILFSGTPCQINGLRNYLRKDYDNLFCIDLICHGVPSPAIFSLYLTEQEQIAQNHVSEINFREKYPSWELYSMKLNFEDGSKYINDMNTDPFLKSFLGNYCLRESCYSCKYTNLNRQGDITLGDFWGYLSEERKLHNDHLGISLVLVNTLKGQKFFNSISHDLVYSEKSLDEAVLGNPSLRSPSLQPSLYTNFWKDFFNEELLSSNSAIKIRLNSPSIKYTLRLWFDEHFYLFPYPLKSLYRIIKYREAAKKIKINE